MINRTKRRVKQLLISPRWFETLFEKDVVIEVTGGGLPKGYKVESLHVLPSRDGLSVVISHDSFDEIEPLETIPTLSDVVFRRTYKEDFSKIEEENEEEEERPVKVKFREFL